MAAPQLPTRANLVTETAVLLRRQGYSGTGLKEILAASGCPKGSLYHYFPGGKDELVVAALEAAGSRVEQVLQELLPHRPRPNARQLRDDISAVFGRFRMELEQSDYREGCPLATVALEIGSENLAIKNAIRAIYKRWSDAISEYLKSQGVRGQQCSEAANTILYLVEGALLMARTEQDSRPLARAEKATLALVAAARTRRNETESQSNRGRRRKQA